MGARQKLDGSYANGSLFLAAVVGWLAESLLVFMVALALLLAGNMVAGEIRMKQRIR